MRFLPLTGLALLIAIALGAPYGLGVLAESRFTQVVDALENRSDEQWRLRLVDYNRHYLSATARTELLPPRGDDSEGASVEPIPLITHFEHGISGIRAVTRLQNDQAGVFKTLFPTQKPRLRLDAGLTARVDGHLRIPAFSWSPDIDLPLLAGSEGSVDALVMTADWSVDGEHSLELDWPGLIMHLGTAKITLEEASLSQRFEPMLDNLWQGEGQFLVDRITLDPLLGDPIIARNASFRVASSVREGYFSSNLKLAIESFETEQTDFGRQVFEWTTDALHARTLDAVLVELRALRRQEQSQEGALSDRARGAMAHYRALSDALQRLSAHGGRMAVPELLLRLPEGRIEGEMVLNYPRRPVSERDQPVSLLRHARGEGVLTIDRQMAWMLPDGAREFLERLERRKVIDAGNQAYHLDVRLSDMKLRLNDQVLDVPPLL